MNREKSASGSLNPLADLSDAELERRLAQLYILAEDRGEVWTFHEAWRSAGFSDDDLQDFEDRAVELDTKAMQRGSISVANGE